MIRLRDPATGAEAQWHGDDPQTLRESWSGDPAFIRDVLLRFIMPDYSSTGFTMQDCIRGRALAFGLEVLRETPAPTWALIDNVPGSQP